MTLQISPPAQAERLHGLDAMRLLLMLLGIPYHAAMIYGIDQSWLIRSPRNSAVLTDLLLALHSFRLGAFFILAGFFAALVEIRQGPEAWLRTRLLQLGVPLVFCTLVLTPPQLVLAALANGTRPAPGFGAALATVGAVAAHPSKLWVLHLWFLVDLLLICAAFGLCCRWARLVRLAGRVPAAAGRLAIRAPGLMQAALLLVFLLATLAVQLFHIALHVREVTLFSGLIPVQSTLYYGGFFLLGVALQRSPSLFGWFGRFDAANLVLAVLAPLLCVAAARSHSHAAQAGLMFLQSVSAVCVGRVLFWAANRFVRAPSHRIRRGADAAFTVYLVHHPIVAALGVLALRLALPPLLGWSAIVVLAAVLSLAFHDRLVRRSRVLGLLFNGRLRSRGLSAPVLPDRVPGAAA